MVRGMFSSSEGILWLKQGRQARICRCGGLTPSMMGERIGGGGVRQHIMNEGKRIKIKPSDAKAVTHHVPQVDTVPVLLSNSQNTGSLSTMV